MPRISSPMIQTATDVARLALSRSSGDITDKHQEVVAAVLAACSALERHQDDIVGLKSLLALARRACGADTPDPAPDPGPAPAPAPSPHFPHIDSQQ